MQRCSHSEAAPRISLTRKKTLSGQTRKTCGEFTVQEINKERWKSERVNETDEELGIEEGGKLLKETEKERDRGRKGGRWDRE